MEDLKEKTSLTDNNVGRELSNVESPTVMPKSENKPSFFKRVRDDIFANSAKEAVDYTKRKIVIPKIKEFLASFINTFINNWILGGDISPKSPSESASSKRNYYNSIFDGAAPFSASRDVQSVAGVTSDPMTYNYLLFKTEGDANHLLTLLRNEISAYGKVSIQTIYDKCNIPSDNWQGNTSYGWRNLTNIEPELTINDKGEQRYKIRFPKAEAIK